MKASEFYTHNSTSTSIKEYVEKDDQDHTIKIIMILIILLVLTFIAIIVLIYLKYKSMQTPQIVLGKLIESKEIHL